MVCRKQAGDVLAGILQQICHIFIMRIKGGAVDTGLRADILDGDGGKGLGFKQADQRLVHFFCGI